MSAQYGNNIRICHAYFGCNTVTHHVYVGTSVVVKRRLRDHKSALAESKHSNDHMQRSYNVYGKENFIWGILQEFPENERKQHEQEWIDFFESSNPEKGFNKDHTVRTVSPSVTRSKITKEMWQDPEFVSHISKIRQETGSDPEFKLKVSNSQKANWQDPEFVAKMKQRDENLKLRSDFREIRRELASKQWENPETRAKGVKATTIQWQDPEKRAVMIAAQRAGWAKKRESRNEIV